MYQKLIIKAEIEVLTGLHIGGSSAYSAIGAVSSPVIKDPITQQPIIPGSSIKGKLRTLMARNLSDKSIPNEPKNDDKKIKRLFGSSQGDKTEGDKLEDNKPYIARLQFCDCFMNNAKELKEVGTTEVKFENDIKRLTARANPRQIERVIRGTKFDFNLIYNVPNKEEFYDKEKKLSQEQLNKLCSKNINEDFENLADGFKLLQMDYLGGSGTRGYGKVAFRNFKVTAFNTDEKNLNFDIEKLKGILKSVENSETFETFRSGLE